MSSPVLQVEQLSVEFATHRAALRVLDGVSFTVDANQIVGIVGESGSGKSTAVRSVIRLLPPAGRITSGTILLQGADLAAHSAKQMRAVRGAQIGFVAQNPFSALNPVMPIGKQFANVMRAHGQQGRNVIEDRAGKLLADVGISDPARVLHGYAHQLSGGMAQRVVLALALCLDPTLLIADEPTTALDLTVQRQVLDMMRDLIRSSGRSMLLVTHDLTVVASYCDSVAVMYGGRVVESGDVIDVFTRPQHPYTRALLDSAAGEPAALPAAGSRPDPGGGGCVYASFCNRVTDACRSVRPELRAHDGPSAVACHNPLIARVAVDANAGRA